MAKILIIPTILDREDRKRVWHDDYGCVVLDVNCLGLNPSSSNFAV